jgi:peptide/nickel transport system permease protein
MPVFLVALLFQLFFYKELRWFPSGGRVGSDIAPPEVITGFLLLDTLLRGNWRAFASGLHHIALPAATLAVANLAVITRMTRSSLLEVLSADYVRTARAKGLSEIRVLRHALKNGLIPVVTVVGLQFASMIASVFLVEHVFSWPGLGSYAVRAILGLDFQPIMAITLLLSVIYVAVNFAVDLIYLTLDPRITY